MQLRFGEGKMALVPTMLTGVSRTGISGDPQLYFEATPGFVHRARWRPNRRSTSAATAGSLKERSPGFIASVGCCYGTSIVRHPSGVSCPGSVCPSALERWSWWVFSGPDRLGVRELLEHFGFGPASEVEDVPRIIARDAYIAVPVASLLSLDFAVLHCHAGLRGRRCTPV